MWIFNGQEAWNEQENKYYERQFEITKVPIRDNLGKATREIAHYLISESWTSLEQPEFWGRGFCLRHDKRITALSFSTREQADSFLELLVWVLNAPVSVSLEEIISPSLVAISLNNNLEVIQNIVAKEQEASVNETKLYGTKVYIFEFNNNTIKIGISNNVINRATHIKSNSGLNILKWCCTEGFDQRKARDIEFACHTFFNNSKTQGEFFATSYETAKEYLQTLAPIVCESE